MSETIIQKLELAPHPEGGYYREVIKGAHDSGRAPYSSIYFLLRDQEVSHFHRIDADEIWYHHEGATLLIHMIYPDGSYESVQLGHQLEQGDVYQYVVPKGTIFASSVKDQEGYALVGCMCQPAFEFEQFELFDKEELIEQYPEHASIIEKYAK
ncbi:cupin domain-containing protein [Staphylococcus massiliensis]|uniref:DUF985 domain-containing protein n=1 Tax=Staphylococcus massiliensis S46 TaxID=1229783 RepID=K9AMI5_9STAP|nr:cupin domain-containing protein [Staphylococcus massiliensis]EKU48603.1 hypothetical protein C273_05330 [Staphylococcus massiliensis S46]MCG3400249.1 cupin domain-containing protein [Staphylococcus massiliensis]MCG3413132.1 cupin domain-containing protein [Staphylococcus massiliensis]PNZ98456.1 cupin [Staphylococcus massiliensis CCUG 55927]